jgi:hypothetical protein
MSKPSFEADDNSDVLRCTRLKQFTKNGAPRACNLAWCDRDLAKRYGTNASAARERGRAGEEGEFQGHDPEASYLFICPCCSDQCQNSTCELAQHERNWEAEDGIQAGRRRV